MPLIVRFHLCSILLLLAGTSPLLAADPPPTLYVATTGVDTNPGTKELPLKTIAAALAKAQVDNSIFVRAGTYRQTGTLNMTKAGVILRSMPGETATVEHGDGAGATFNIAAARVTLYGMVLNGRYVSGSRAITGQPTGSHFTAQALTVRNYTRHALDIDGADCQIIGSTINNILWYDAAQGGRVDAHGIVTTNAQRMTIRSCKIYNVSGDCFQAGRGNWQDIVIQDCSLLDKPLPAAAAGFPKGALAAENAIDTKVATTRAPARLTIRGCNIGGFRTTLIGNAAALNLKENIDAIVESCTIDNSVIGLRLRAPAKVAVINTAVTKNDFAVRYEDGIADLKLAQNTFYNNKSLFKRAPSGSPGGAGWIVTNNLFAGVALPAEAPGPKNVTCPTTSIDTTTLKPKVSTGLLGTPVTNFLPTWYTGLGLRYDLAKKVRSTTTPTVGAYEYIAP